MIEISNVELSKVLNLWTGTEDWHINKTLSGSLDCGPSIVRSGIDGEIYLPRHSKVGQKDYDLVNFMLKERKYPDDVADIFYPTGYINNHEVYVEWVKKWENVYGDKPQDDQLKTIDHSVPVRYDHLLSTEELVKRAQERWPDDRWSLNKGDLRGDGWWFGSEGEVIANANYGPRFDKYRTKLLTLISEAEETIERPVCQDIPEATETKAERFYAFLATPQPDISLGLWGIVRETKAPVRGGDEGWARENIGALTDCPIAQSEYMTVMDIPQDTVGV